MSGRPDTLDLSGLSGTQRAAVLLLMLGERYGPPIWSMLTEDEVKKVSRAMIELGSIQADTVESLIVDFVTRLSSAGGVTGTPGRTEELLGTIFPPEQAQAILSDIKGASGRRLWQKLSETEPPVLASFLAGEYPQTAAVVLSRVGRDYAARVLAAMPEDLAAEVVTRMLCLEPVREDALGRVEDLLKSEFVAGKARPAAPDPHALMAEVFNGFDRPTEARFMAALEHTDGDAARKIRELMFTFEDLAKLDPGSIQTVLRFVDKAVLGRALKGASEEIRAVFFANMSSRATKNLQEEMASLGPIRAREAEEAQGAMLAVAKDLAGKGEIMIARSRADEEELVF